LAERGPDVCAFEGSLSGTNFDELIVGELNGARTMEAQMVVVFWMAGLQSSVSQHTIVIAACYCW